MKTQQTHEESGCPDYLQHNAESCPHMDIPLPENPTPDQAPREQTISDYDPEYHKKHPQLRKPDPASHSPLPWQALDGMILCDKVNKYGNFYVAEVSPDFQRVSRGSPAQEESEQNLAFIVRACNEYETLKAQLQVTNATVDHYEVETLPSP